MNKVTVSLNDYPANLIPIFIGIVFLIWAGVDYWFYSRGYGRSIVIISRVYVKKPNKTERRWLIWYGVCTKIAISITSFLIAFGILKI